MKAIPPFSENAPSDKMNQHLNTRFLCYGSSHKIDTALYKNEKRHRLEGYFNLDMILNLSHQGTLAGA